MQFTRYSTPGIDGFGYGDGESLPGEPNLGSARALDAAGLDSARVPTNTKMWTLEELHSLPDDGLLVVEIISPGTRRRDHEQKKPFYLDAGVAEYWIVDPALANITVVRPWQDDRVEGERVEWRPPGREAVLTVSIDEVFGARR